MSKLTKLEKTQPGFFSPDHLKNAAVQAGLNLDDMENAIAEPSSHHQEADENQDALEQSGHWGVPTFVFNGEPFFGQDRIETLYWRLKKENLALF